MWFWKKKKVSRQPAASAEREVPKAPEPGKEPEEKRQKWLLEIDEDADFPIEEGLIWNQYPEGGNGRILQSRKPKEHFQEYPLGDGFQAAGKVYSAEKMLRAGGREWVWDYDSSGYHDMMGEFTDAYGRRVCYISERFPCYDRYDRQYENRFYRYYFLCEDHRLTRIRFADGSRYVAVTEDAASIEYRHWRKLKEQKWIV